MTDLPATLRMDINADAIAANIALLRSKLTGGCELSGVVKANAYGLGVANVAPVMKSCGIELFFVANLPEAVQLRGLLGSKPRIAVLGGFYAESHAWQDFGIIPCLNSVAEIEHWNDRGASFLHIDTAMNRLGVRYDEMDALPASYKPDMVMSHFANADDRGDPLTPIQYQRFMDCLPDKFKDVPKSLANSAGIFEGDQYHLGCVRAGKAIFGAAIYDDGDNTMQRVVNVNAHILAVNQVKAGETAGYGATYLYPADTITATLGVGYADGLPRTLSNCGHLFFNGHACPIRGRVSMDLTIIEVGHLPEIPKAGEWVEIIGAHQSELDLARVIGTNTYEITTNFGSGSRLEYAITQTRSGRTVEAA